MSAASRLLVFGATGRTGRRLVAEAAKRGLRVAVFIRDAARVPPGATEVHVGDVRDPDQVHAAVREGDLVVAALGGRDPDGRGGAIRDGARAIVAAARAAGAARLLAVVGAGVLQLDTTRQRHEAPDYPPMLRSVGAEHQALHQSFAESGLWWALVCTPKLIDEDPTGRMVGLADYLPDGTGVVTTGDVAALLLDLATEPAAKGGRIGVSSRRGSRAVGIEVGMGVGQLDHRRRRVTGGFAARGAEESAPVVEAAWFQRVSTRIISAAVTRIRSRHLAPPSQGRPRRPSQPGS